MPVNLWNLQKIALVFKLHQQKNVPTLTFSYLVGREPECSKANEDAAEEAGASCKREGPLAE